MKYKNIIKYSMLLVLTMLMAGCPGAGFNFPPVNFNTMPKAGEYPDMPAVVLLDSATLEFTAMKNGKLSPHALLTHHRRYQILTPKGLDYATIVLPVDAHSSIRSIKGRLVYPDGREHYLAADEFQSQPGRERAEMGRLIARLPNPEVGAVIDYWYERVYDDARYVPLWNMGGELPVKRAEFAVVADKNILLDMRAGSGQFISEEQPIRRDLDANRVRLLWIKNDLSPLFPEAAMPDLQRLRAWVSPVFQGVTINGTTMQAGAVRKWEDVADWYFETTKNIQNIPASPKNIARESSEIALYQWLQSRATSMHSNYLWEIGAASYDDIEAGKPVAVRDLAAFFIAALQAKGVVAYPLLVVRPGGRLLTIDLPSLIPFATVLVAIDNGGTYKFIDPGCPTCGYGELPRELQGGAGLLLKNSEEVEFINLPLSQPQQNLRHVDLNFRLRNTGELEGVFTLRAHGEAARELRAALLKSQSEQRQALMAAIADSGTTLQISNWEVADLKNLGAPLRVTGSCKAVMNELKYQEYKFTADQITGELYHHLWRNSRRYQLATGGPLDSEITITIELPVGYEADQPLPVAINSEFGSYSSSYKVEGRTFSFNRDFIINQPMIESEEYADFLEFIKKSRQAEGLGVTFLSTEE